jgi:hypothetical protein
MEILIKNKVERDHVKVPNIELFRIKTYNSNTGESNIQWYFKKNKVKVKQRMYRFLEKRYNQIQRKSATITK